MTVVKTYVCRKIIHMQAGALDVAQTTCRNRESGFLNFVYIYIYIYIYIYSRSYENRVLPTYLNLSLN